MNALSLLTQLLKLQASGCDLSQIGVVTVTTEYDPSIPYDRGVDVEHFPNDAELSGGTLYIR